MEHIREMLAAVQKEELVDALDRALGPDDQAWFVCSFSDCRSNIKGRCTIHTFASPPKIVDGKPCEHYEKRA